MQCYSVLRYKPPLFFFVLIITYMYSIKHIPTASGSWTAFHALIWRSSWVSFHAFPCKSFPHTCVIRCKVFLFIFCYRKKPKLLPPCKYRPDLLRIRLSSRLLTVMANMHVCLECPQSYQECQLALNRLVARLLNVLWVCRLAQEYTGSQGTHIHIAQLAKNMAAGYVSLFQTQAYIFTWHELHVSLQALFVTKPCMREATLPVYIYTPRAFIWGGKNIRA